MFSIVPTPGDFSTHGIQNFGKRLFHVFGLIDFIVSVRSIKSQDWYTIFVNHTRIYFTKAVFSGNGFSTSGHPYMGAEEITVILFKRSTISACFFLLAIYFIIAIEF